MHMPIIKNMPNNTMYIVLDLHAFVSNEIAFNEIASIVSLLSISLSSIFLLHSSINLSITLLLHLQLLWFKYSPMPHDLSYSQSQLLGFQVNLVSHIPLSINSLHLHLHLSSLLHTLHTLCIHCYIHFHLIYICICMFYDILCVLFHFFLKLD